jgi:hypothetical protein
LPERVARTPRSRRVTQKEDAMGQQHSDQNKTQDDRRKKAKNRSDKEQQRGMPGTLTFKNDPDGKTPKAKPEPEKRH